MTDKKKAERNLGCDQKGFTLWFTGLPCSGKSAVADRVAEMLKERGLKLLTRNGVVVLTSFISPYRKVRAYARQEIGNFIEIFVRCPLEVCIERDVKGMYNKAIKGEIKEFTGISDPYEEPLNPELILDTDKETLEESASKVIQKLNDLGYID